MRKRTGQHYNPKFGKLNYIQKVLEGAWSQSTHRTPLTLGWDHMSPRAGPCAPGYHRRMPHLRAPVSILGCLYSPFYDMVTLNWLGLFNGGLVNAFSLVKTKKQQKQHNTKQILIHSICQVPWYKYTHQDWFQATSGTRCVYSGAKNRCGQSLALGCDNVQMP